ncbi:MAG TPA: YihY/virulence factor BrkB family protein [Pyrinomonadaceae bacterium]|nr:YihY/virulence factor BrkB family protein [Pyrinomonadaceae bacterium]
MRMLNVTEFPFKEFGWALYAKIFDTDIFSRAAQVAFYFSFALFPLLYFLVSLFGIVIESSEGLRGELFSYLRQIMPLAVFDLVSRTVEEIVVNSTGGKATLGLAVTLWSASAGVDAIRTALNEIYGLKDSRNWFKTKAQSILFTLIVSVLTTAILAIVFYGWQLFQYGLARLGLEVSSPFLLVSIQWISILVIMLLACEIIYNLLPDFKRFRWVWITPGSVVAILVWIILTTGFRTYLGYFNSYNKAYGSLGAVIIMMLWLYLTASALMIGGAINAVLHEMREKAENESVEAETLSA